MPRSPTRISVRRLAKLARYSAVSITGTTTTLVLLGVLVGWVNMDPTWANLLAAGSSTALSFELDRRWVWRRNGRPAFLRQIVPFWVWSLSELALATFVVGRVGHFAEHRHWAHGTVTTLVELTSIAVSLGTWCVQYVLFDRIFRDPVMTVTDASVPPAVSAPPGTPPG